MSQATCPVCEESYTVQGLYGHLRKHDLHGDELRELYQQAVHEHDQALSEEEVPEVDEVTKLELNEEGGLNRRELGAEESADEPGDLPSALTPQDPAKKDEPFNWEDRLERVESIRSDLEELKGRFNLFERLFQNADDEGVNESLEALDRIEIEIREQIGAEGQDQELRQSVDQSLELIKGLTKCREQREAIKEKFDGEEAERRVDRLGQREAQIRVEVRARWDVGKPTSDLDSDDPVCKVEESTEDSGDSDGGVFGVGRGLITKLVES